MKENIDFGKGFLKDRLGDYRVDPPEEVWSMISDQVGRGNRKRWWLIVVPAAASVALALTLGILREPSQPERAQQIGTDQPSQGTVTGQDRETAAGGRATVVDEAGAAGEVDPGGVVTDAEEPGREGMRFAEPAESERTGFAGPAEADKKHIEPAITDRTRFAAVADSERPGVTTGLRIAAAGTAVEGVVIGPDRVEISGEEVLASIGNSNEGTDTGTGKSTEGSVTGHETVGPEGIIPGLLPEEESGENSKRWALAAVLSPQYSYRDAENQATSGIPAQETGMLAYAGGINVSFSPASRLALESGVFFNRMGVDVNATRITPEAVYILAPISQADALPMISASNTIGNIVTRSGEVYVNNYMLNGQDAANIFRDNYSTISTGQGIRQQLDYLEVPFNLRYTVIDRDLEVQLVGGFSTNFLLNSNVIIESSSGNSSAGYLTNIRNLNYSGNAGVGMVYHIAGNFNLRLEPRFRYFLNSVNDSSLPATRPYAFGLYTGLSFLF